MSRSDFEIIGDFDRDVLYCAGSFTKLLTTFVCLSKLAEYYSLNEILDDDQFLDRLCSNTASKSFLMLFQKIIGSPFSIRDVCTFYNGLPYTFDLSRAELDLVEQGYPFKHHSIMDEETFLMMCRDHVTQMDPNHSKFHYSEIAILFLGYLLEKVYDVSIESLYQQYVIDAFNLQNSLFSRIKPDAAFYVDLSDKYDYPSVAVLNHGYFCYSNGFFTTLHDEKKLLEQLIVSPVFLVMSDVRHARAASPRLLNGLTVEIRLVGDDVLYGYEGLSYSGCNIWAYSTKFNKGYVGFTDDEDRAYDIYAKFGYKDFDSVPESSELCYREFIKREHYDFTDEDIPLAYIGDYERVNINEKRLAMVFSVGQHHIEIRNPERVKYSVINDHGIYRITCKDHMHGIKVGFHQAKSGNCYMMFDGTLYRKI